MKYFLVLAFSLFFSIDFAWAQVNYQKSLDSLLLEEVKYKKEDSAKVALLKDITWHYIRVDNVPKFLEYSQKTITLAKKLDTKDILAYMYFFVGRHYHGSSNYLKAEENYLISLDVRIKQGRKDRVALLYGDLAALYTSLPDYAKALEVSQKALQIYQELNDESSQGNCFANLGNLYQKMNLHGQGVYYLERALKIFLKDGEESRGVAFVCHSLGRTYFSAPVKELKVLKLSTTQKNDVALKYLNRALKSAIAIKDDDISGTIYKAIGDVYAEQENKHEALTNYEKAVQLNNNEYARKDYVEAQLAIAKVQFDDQKYKEANKLITEALKTAKKYQFVDMMRDAHLMLSNLYEKTKNYNFSLRHYRAYIDAKEQIFNQEKEREITRKQMQLDFSVKENDYQAKQQLTNLELEKQLLIVKRRQQELLLKQQQLELSDKEKNIQRLSFLQTQASLEREKLQKENQLRQQKLLANLEKEKASQQLLVQENKVKLNRNFSVFFGVLAIILLGVALFVYRTQRKTAKLNQLVSAQKEELESLGKVKDRIFSVVSHDMRAPVNSLISFINLLENSNVSEEKLKRYAANLKNSLGYTSSMMENLLNWAASQLEGYRPHIEEINLLNCLTDVIDVLEVNAIEKSILIQNNISPTLTCHADCDMLNLVIRNLLSNAIKFTHAEGIIEISAIEKGVEIQLAIKDNGVGLPKEEVERFNSVTKYGVNKPTLGTNKEKGTGIGLSLCKTFIHLMNGKISLKSELDKGSIFFVDLPK